MTPSLLLPLVTSIWTWACRNRSGTAQRPERFVGFFFFFFFCLAFFLSVLWAFVPFPILTISHLYPSSAKYLHTFTLHFTHTLHPPKSTSTNLTNPGCRPSSPLHRCAPGLTPPLHAVFLGTHQTFDNHLASRYLHRTYIPHSSGYYHSPRATLVLIP